MADKSGMDRPAHTVSLQDIKSLALVGAGKMGAALLQQWIARGLDLRRVTVIEPQPSGELSALTKDGLQLNPSRASLAAQSVVIIAVKPQIADEVLADTRALVGADTIVISIMAGRTLSFLSQALPSASLVRVMPNLPAAIGCGITVAVASDKVSTQARNIADMLLAATGKVEWVADEGLLDAVTALSGTGPAYVFLLAETLAAAGVAAGLPQDLSTKLARATVAGAGELLDRSPLDPSTLRDNVTSPGGTTSAAMTVLMASDGMQPLMTRAVMAAKKRASELAN